MMTAVEYLKKKSQHDTLYVTLSVLLPALTVGAWIFVALKRGLFSPSSNRFFFSVCGVMIAGVIVVVLVMEILQRSFKARYPEMAYLNEWLAVGMPAERYPVTLHHKRLLIPEISTRLQLSAKFVNLAIAMRNCIGAMNTFLPGSAEWDLVETIRARLGREAEAQNQQYLKEWNLFVDSMAILPTRDLWRDARTYRESLLKKN